MKPKLMAIAVSMACSWIGAEWRMRNRQLSAS